MVCQSRVVLQHESVLPYTMLIETCSRSFTQLLFLGRQKEGVCTRATDRPEQFEIWYPPRTYSFCRFEQISCLQLVQFIRYFEISQRYQEKTHLFMNFISAQNKGNDHLKVYKTCNLSSELISNIQSFSSSRCAFFSSSHLPLLIFCSVLNFCSLLPFTHKIELQPKFALVVPSFT